MLAIAVLRRRRYGRSAPPGLVALPWGRTRPKRGEPIEEVTDGRTTTLRYHEFVLSQDVVYEDGMPSDGEITFADHAGRFYARRFGMAPMVGRLIGYLGG